MTAASIVTHNTPFDQLRTALDCLAGSSVDKIYIIDNSPTDKLKTSIRNYPGIIYMHVENRGYGAAHNIAIRKSIEEGADYHLVMNADVWWEGDVPGKMSHFMNTHPEVGLMSPKTFYPDGSLQYTCRMLPTPMDMWLRGFLPEKWVQHRMSRYLMKDVDHSHSINCPYLLGSFLFFRTAALRETGLFDERFFMYPEDIDITRRVHEKWQTLYWPYASIVHEHQQASKKSLRMFGIHLVNMVRYFNKWGWFKDRNRKIFNRRLYL